MPSADSPAQILLAEDNPADVRLVREALDEHAIWCELRVIVDGEAAMQFIDQLNLQPETPCPDLLLLDLHLPKFDGEEVLRHLRASERCGQTPVVVFTSSEFPRDRQPVGKNTIVHYFRKPSTLSQFMKLGALVKEVIHREGAA